MNIYLGNIRFDQVLDTLGYQLTNDDKLLWDEFYCHNADLSGKASGFHVFDIPRCIQFKGEPAKQAIIKMFSSDKLTNPKGQFAVYEIK